MTREEIRRKALETANLRMGINPNDVVDAASLDETFGDSLGAVEFVVWCDDYFGTNISNEEFWTLASFKDVIDILCRKLDAECCRPLEAVA